MRASFKTHKGMVYAFLRYNNRQIMVSTGIESVTEMDKDVFFSKSEPSYRSKNKRLMDMRDELDTLMASYTLRTSAKDARLEERFRAIVSPSTVRTTLKDYMETYRSTCRTEGTRRVYMDTIRKIESFDPGCTLTSVDTAWLRRFEDHCARTMSVNGYSIHLRNIRTVFNWAIREELTTEYPFTKFRIRHEDTQKRSLEMEEIYALLEARKSLTGGEKSRGRQSPQYIRAKYIDIFLLMMYLGGISPVDLCDLEPCDGYVTFRRAKTGIPVRNIVHDDARAIIERYRGTAHLIDIKEEYTDYRTFFKRQAMYLSSLLGHSVSAYWARHTAATVLADLGTPEVVIGRILGHKDASVTGIYIRVNQRNADEYLMRMVEKMKSHHDDGFDTFANPHGQAT